MERIKRKPSSGEEKKPVISKILIDKPLIINRTGSSNVVQATVDKLRILDLEREILSYAVRRLFEAQSEGKINEEERNNLMLKYKNDLKRIKEEITRGESVVALNEMEIMQQDFVNLFSERFEQLNEKIMELKELSGQTKSQKKPLLDEIKKTKETSTIKRKTNKQKMVSKPQKIETNKKPNIEEKKGEAEKKIDKIVNEVEKVLERLGQMEVEE
jgi:hypothetical protein